MTTADSPAVARARILAPGVAAPLAVGAMTLVALALRLPGLEQSLFADELFTHEIASADGIGDVLDALQRTENNPPLFYYLAWAAARLGDPTVWIRVPSLILGTATVPVVYLLGRRTVGAPAGMLAAGFVVLSPFAIFYSNEGRAYAALAFLSAMAALLLLVALERRSWPWWLAYGASVWTMLYTHYTSALVLAAQAAWALWLHREQLRELVAVYAAVGLAFVPWLPYYSDQNPFFGFEKLGAPMTVESVLRGLVSAVLGHPFVPLSELPGAPALVLGGVALAIAVGAGLAALRRLHAERRRIVPAERLTLLLLVAIATPAGLVLYSLLGPDVWQARNLTASLPALYLVLAATVVALPRFLSLTAAGCLLVALAVGAVKSIDADYQRPPLRQAAERVEARSQPGDAVVDLLFQGNYPGLRRGLEVNFERPHRIYKPGVDDEAAWRRAAAGSHVFLVVPQVGVLKGTPERSGPGDGYPLRSARVYRGFMPVGVFEYGRGR
jgi:mannosyltransferase